MIINVSVNQFRQNVTDYLAKIGKGYIVILEDDKKNRQIIQLTGKKKFNPKTFGDALQAAGGIFKVKKHPEWKTKESIIKWGQRQ